MGDIIDLHLFAELVRLDEKDEQPFLDDRISNYFYPSVKCIYAMMDDLRSGDYHKLEQEAFELRSLASSLAVVRVAQLCSFIENKCRSGINERDHIEIDSTLRVMELANQFAQDWLDVSHSILKDYDASEWLLMKSDPATFTASWQTAESREQPTW
ncbi:hypothetical protein PGT21_036954 [Puccinia graminis f. sp. tritici]|uniref:HPt domain-containing protein n=1 Tax=Puccinia graminis f. sp. tritici TaxID=56615 RepID=A0A5B0QDF8_PUCGR|nr:hypothetical protein PGT21_036954 [Puccinia graminis f. sp. tritici]